MSPFDIQRPSSHEIEPPTKTQEVEQLPLEEKVAKAMTSMNRVLLGKETQIKQAFCCIIAGGHLLIEDLPGMGKTTLAHLLAKVMGLDSQRVQFTSDLLPSDILGVNIFNQEAQRFKFISGPIFTQVLLADEINRSTPKTQSALLEAMAEQQVTIEGVKRELPQPFFVVATQNPEDQVGTYPLPESQMDRFMMRVSMGYPHARAEKALLLHGPKVLAQLERTKPVFAAQDIVDLRQQVNKVSAQEALVDYIQRMLEFTRHDQTFAYGISPRGGLALLQAAKAWALLNGRRQVFPEDVQEMLSGVWAHRLRPASDQYNQSYLISRLLELVPVVA